MAASSSKGRSSGRGRSSGTGTRGRSAGTRRSSGRGTAARSGGTGARGARSRSGRGRAASRGSAAGENERTKRGRAAQSQGRSQGARRSSTSRSSTSRSGASRSGASRGRSAQGSRSAQGTRSRSRAAQPARGGRTASRSTTRRGSSTSRAPRTSRRSRLDPIAMLKEDHRRVEKLFEQFEKAKDAKKKQQLFGSIRNELELHARLEEEVFYPAVEQRQELKSEVKEAHGEHDKVKQMLREAEGLDPDSGEFDATVAGIQGAVEHHVEEEENEMFPSVRETFSEEHLKELAEKMNELKSAAARGNGAMEQGRSLVGRLMGR